MKATNSEAYENLKLAERLKKRKYRLKKKQEEKAQSNQPPPHTPSHGTSSSSKYKCTKNRVMNRVEKVFPESPRKSSEVLQNIAKKFNLRIAYRSAKCGKKKNMMIEEEQECLDEFLDRSDIYTNPGRKESICVKTYGVEQFIPKRYLLWTIREIFEIVNGSDIINSCETFPDRFQKKSTFRQLYDFLKFRKDYIFNRSIPHLSCLCEICENVVMLCIVINKII